jgi:hypothetical protein
LATMLKMLNAANPDTIPIEHFKKTRFCFLTEHPFRGFRLLLKPKSVPQLGADNMARTCSPEGVTAARPYGRTWRFWPGISDFNFIWAKTICKPSAGVKAELESYGQLQQDGKLLRAAREGVERVLGAQVEVQCCQIHKRRNMKVSMANCYFAKPHGVKHCYIPFLMFIDFKRALNFGEAQDRRLIFNFSLRSARFEKNPRNSVTLR